MPKQKSTWDNVDNLGQNIKEGVHSAWAQSELKKARGQSGWLGMAANEGLDAAAFVMDGASINTDPYAERYRLIEKAKRANPSRVPSDALMLINQGKLPGER